LLRPASESKVVMSDVDKFINIFEGSYSAYGQTRKTDEFDERGKHKTKSFIIKQRPTKQMFFDHLKGDSRKQKGSSLPKDLKVKRVETYWKQI